MPFHFRPCSRRRFPRTENYDENDHVAVYKMPISFGPPAGTEGLSFELLDLAAFLLARFG